MATVDLHELLDDTARDTSHVLDGRQRVASRARLDPDALPQQSGAWHHVAEATVVVAALANATRLLWPGRQPTAVAPLYEASTAGAVRILAGLGADLTAVRDGGAIGVFSAGDRRERAACAALTIGTFSRNHLVPTLERAWPDRTETGLTVGVASGDLLVKRVEGGSATESPRGVPVWVGRAVDYAAKAAHQARRHEVVVTGTVWEWLADNDFLAFSCPCAGDGYAPMWREITIEEIPRRYDRHGQRGAPTWCDEHGPEYCERILRGERRRNETRRRREALDRARGRRGDSKGTS